jgi:hypothetical protein
MVGGCGSLWRRRLAGVVCVQAGVILYNGVVMRCPKEPGVSDIEKLAAMLADDELTTTKLVDGTGVILDVDSLQVFTLNETGMFLVEALGEGVADRQGLVARMVESFEVEDDVAGEDVDAFIGDLATFLLEKRRK